VLFALSSEVGTVNMRGVNIITMRVC